MPPVDGTTRRNANTHPRLPSAQPTARITANSSVRQRSPLRIARTERTACSSANVVVVSSDVSPRSLRASACIHCPPVAFSTGKNQATKRKALLGYWTSMAAAFGGAAGGGGSGQTYPHPCGLRGVRKNPPSRFNQCLWAALSVALCATIGGSNYNEHLTALQAVICLLMVMFPSQVCFNASDPKLQDLVRVKGFRNFCKRDYASDTHAIAFAAVSGLTIAYAKRRGGGSAKDLEVDPYGCGASTSGYLGAGSEANPDPETAVAAIVEEGGHHWVACVLPGERIFRTQEALSDLLVTKFALDGSTFVRDHLASAAGWVKAALKGMASRLIADDRHDASLMMTADCMEVLTALSNASVTADDEDTLRAKVAEEDRDDADDAATPAAFRFDDEDDDAPTPADSSSRTGGGSAASAAPASSDAPRGSILSFLTKLASKPRRPAGEIAFQHTRFSSCPAA